MASENFGALKKKEIIDTVNGRRLGLADDFIFDPDSGRIISVTARDRSFFCFLPLRGEAFEIPWESIDKIGSDFILIRGSAVMLPMKKEGFFVSLLKSLLK